MVEEHGEEEEEEEEDALLHASSLVAEVAWPHKEEVVDAEDAEYADEELTVAMVDKAVVAVVIVVVVVEVDIGEAEQQQQEEEEEEHLWEKQPNPHQ